MHHPFKASVSWFSICEVMMNKSLTSTPETDLWQIQKHWLYSELLLLLHKQTISGRVDVFPESNLTRLVIKSPTKLMLIRVSWCHVPAASFVTFTSESDSQRRIKNEFVRWERESRNNRSVRIWAKIIFTIHTINYYS